MTTELDLETQQARRLWRAFLKRLDWTNRDQSRADRDDARAEAAAHMREAMGETTPETEAEALAAAIASYGPLPGPPPPWRKPLAVVGHYLAIMVLGATGLIVLALAHMTVMEVFNPAGVGLWLYPGDDGFTLSYEVQPGAREVLGAWFIPTMVAIIAGLVAAMFALWRFALCPRGPVTGWMKE